MMIRTIAILGALLGALMLGCSGEDHGAHDHGANDGHDHGTNEANDAADATAEIEASLAELSPEDRALAEAQETCPVSGEPLGGMGAPLKVMVKDRPVFICCEGCRKKLLASPDKYLAMLDK